MIDSALCKERILSEDYFDFIVNDIRTPFLSGLPLENVCEQRAGFDYRCVYLSRMQTEPITLEKFNYNSIPNCYAPTSMDTMNQAGILSLQTYPTLQLTGKGVLIGFLDSGIDYQNPIFRNLDGSTRIAAIWDQTIQSGTPPEHFSYGSEYTREMIDEALSLNNPLELVPSTDTDGHGTFTASLAAGSGNPSEAFLGAAPDSVIAVVKLKQAKKYLRNFYFIPDTAVCYQENDILLGLHYLALLAEKLNLPLVFCISVGTNAGGHIGALPLPQVLNSYGSSANRIPVVSVGNESDKRHHYYNEIPDDRTAQTVELRVGENVSGFTMELWTCIPNIVSISLTSPSGESTTRIPIRANASTTFDFLFDRTQVVIDYRLIVEKEHSELIFFRFNAPSPGIWKINVEPVRVIDGRYHIWLPVTEFIDGEVFFLTPNPYYTFTNPGDALSAITVSYYDGNTNAIALASGRGNGRSGQIEPTITAPGINVKGALPDGRYAVRSGGSISAAVTSGAVALMLEWIIYQLGNPSIDSFQIKSLLILGAVRSPSMSFPNREWGYGQLNVYNTLEEIRQL